MSTIHLLVSLQIKLGQSKDFAAMFAREFVSRSLKEEGCQFYQLWAEKDQVDQMSIVETWTSQRALDKHLSQDWFKEWAPVMESYLSEPPTIRFFHRPE